jgi:hypothetical protein
VPPKHNVATFSSYEQRIMVCALVPEMLQLLIADPDGYKNMLMNNESCTRVNGNGIENFFVKKSGNFLEARCKDEGKHFILNLLLIIGIILCSLFLLIFFHSQCLIFS